MSLQHCNYHSLSGHGCFDAFRKKTSQKRLKKKFDDILLRSVTDTAYLIYSSKEVNLLQADYCDRLLGFLMVIFRDGINTLLETLAEKTFVLKGKETFF